MFALLNASRLDEKIPFGDMSACRANARREGFPRANLRARGALEKGSGEKVSALDIRAIRESPLQCSRICVACRYDASLFLIRARLFGAMQANDL